MRQSLRIFATYKSATMSFYRIIQTSTLLFIALLAQSAFAQSTYKVQGILSSQQESVPFATVFVKAKADSAVVKVGISDSLGVFKISGVPAGDFFVEASMVGLKRYYSEPFTISDSNKDMGEIIMQADDELEAIEIVKIRPIIEVHPDKTVFNVENTINATGSNGFDLLRKAPGVIIDNNNNIMLEGKAGVQVYIDHKPTILAGDDLVNYLKSIQASDIDNIEIITQPSSKYDAAGTAGIINIIMKRDKRLGTNGTVQAGWEYGKNHRYNGSINLNNRSKKTNLFGSYSTSQGKHDMALDFDRYQNGFEYISRSVLTSLRNSHNGKVGFDWFANDKHTFGILGSGSYFNAGSNSVTSTGIGLENQPLLQNLSANNIVTGANYQAAGNLNYRFADTLGHELTIDGDYGIYNRESSSFQPNIYTDSSGAVTDENNFRMVTPIDIELISAKFDYSQYLWGGKLGFGGKFSRVNTANIFEFYDSYSTGDTLDAARSNEFYYNETIGAAYVNYGRKLGKKWNLQLGLRYEHTIAKGNLHSLQATALDTVNLNYPQLFPSGGLTWTPNMKNMWSLTFGRRIRRPNYQILNPFVSQLDELSYRQGNPTLQPSFSNNARVSHTFKYRFTSSLSYSYTQNFFAQVTDTIGGNGNFMQTRNVADEQTINLSVALPFQIKKWWSVFLNVGAYHTSYFANDDKFIPVNRATATFYASNTFLLPAGFKFEVSGFFSSPSIWGGTYLVNSLGSLNLAVEKKFMKEKMSLRVAASDIFYTSGWTADLQYGGLSIYGTGAWESQKIAVSLSYNFGNSEVKKARDRKTGLEDEEKRTGGE